MTVEATPEDTQLTILKRIDANVGLLGSAINDVKARVSVLETWRNEVTAGVHPDPFPESSAPATLSRDPALSLTSEVRESLRVQGGTLDKMRKSLTVQTIADAVKIGAVIAGFVWAFWTQLHPAPPQPVTTPTPVVIVDGGEKK